MIGLGWFGREGFRRCVPQKRLNAILVSVADTVSARG